MEKPTRLSAQFSYVISKKLDGISAKGTPGIWGLRVSKLYGICREEYCADDTSLSEEEYQNFPLTIMAYFDAYKRRTPYFQRLYTLDDCTHALYQTGPIQIGFDCFKSIFTAPKGDVPLPQIGEPEVGVHMVLATGYSYNDAYISFVNSWGEKWGNKGHGRLLMAYFEEGLFNEAWVHGTDKPIALEKVHTIFSKNHTKFLVKDNVYKKLRNTSLSNVLVFDLYSTGNILIGFLHATLFTEKNLEIEDFFILPQYQHMGLGTEILKIIEGIVVKNKLHKIIGWIGAPDLVEDREIAVVGFFKKNHFLVTQDNTRYKDAYYKIEKTFN